MNEKGKGGQERKVFWIVRFHWMKEDWSGKTFLAEVSKNWRISNFVEWTDLNAGIDLFANVLSIITELDLKIDQTKQF